MVAMLTARPGNRAIMWLSCGYNQHNPADIELHRDALLVEVLFLIEKH